MSEINPSYDRITSGVILLAAVLALIVMPARPAQAQTEIVLHSFSAGEDGCGPVVDLLLDAEGNLYGTTTGCGPHNGFGTVFEMSCATSNTCMYSMRKDREKILYSFPGLPNAFLPEAGLIQDAKGNLYGTTCCGGLTNHGTVYELSPQPNGTWQETVLYNFTGGADGYGPQGTLAMDGEGNLYGIAAGGGDTQCDAPYGCGLVFKVTPTGTQQVLHSFSGSPDGAKPYGVDLVLDEAGNLYGTTAGGGYGQGTVFEVTPTGSETILHNFTGGADGAYPQAGVVRDSEGNLYGTTAGDGSLGYGTVFEVTASGSETVLYTFTGGTDGNYPDASVILDAEGNLYGTTCFGGRANHGTVFRITAAGVESVLYSFSGSPDGACPEASLVLDSKGNLYGTTVEGGGTECSPYGCGTVFELVP